MTHLTDAKATRGTSLVQIFELHKNKGAEARAVHCFCCKRFFNKLSVYKEHIKECQFNRVEDCIEQRIRACGAITVVSQGTQPLCSTAGSALFEVPNVEEWRAAVPQPRLTSARISFGRGGDLAYSKVFFNTPIPLFSNPPDEEVQDVAHTGSYTSPVAIAPNPNTRPSTRVTKTARTSRSAKTLNAIQGIRADQSPVLTARGVLEDFAERVNAAKQAELAEVELNQTPEELIMTRLGGLIVPDQPPARKRRAKRPKKKVTKVDALNDELRPTVGPDQPMVAILGTTTSHATPLRVIRIGTPPPGGAMAAENAGAVVLGAEIISSSIPSTAAETEKHIGAPSPTLPELIVENLLVLDHGGDAVNASEPTATSPQGQFASQQDSVEVEPIQPVEKEQNVVEEESVEPVESEPVQGLETETVERLESESDMHLPGNNQCSEAEAVRSIDSEPAQNMQPEVVQSTESVNEFQPESTGPEPDQNLKIAPTHSTQSMPKQRLDSKHGLSMAPSSAQSSESKSEQRLVSEPEQTAVSEPERNSDPHAIMRVTTTSEQRPQPEPEPQLQSEARQQPQEVSEHRMDSSKDHHPEPKPPQRLAMKSAKRLDSRPSQRSRPKQQVQRSEPAPLHPPETSPSSPGTPQQPLNYQIPSRGEYYVPDPSDRGHVDDRYHTHFDPIPSGPRTLPPHHPSSHSAANTTSPTVRVNREISAESHYPQYAHEAYSAAPTEYSAENWQGERSYHEQRHPSRKAVRVNGRATRRGPPLGEPMHPKFTGSLYAYNAPPVPRLEASRPMAFRGNDTPLDYGSASQNNTTSPRQARHQSRDATIKRSRERDENRKQRSNSQANRKMNRERSSQFEERVFAVTHSKSRGTPKRITNQEPVRASSGPTKRGGTRTARVEVQTRLPAYEDARRRLPQREASSREDEARRRLQYPTHEVALGEDEAWWSSSARNRIYPPAQYLPYMPAPTAYAPLWPQHAYPVAPQWNSGVTSPQFIPLQGVVPAGGQYFPTYSLPQPLVEVRGLPPQAGIYMPATYQAPYTESPTPPPDPRLAYLPRTVGHSGIPVPEGYDPERRADSPFLKEIRSRYYPHVRDEELVHLTEGELRRYSEQEVIEFLEALNRRREFHLAQTT